MSVRASLAAILILYFSCLLPAQSNTRVTRNLNDGWEYTEQSFSEVKDAPDTGWIPINLPHTRSEPDSREENCSSPRIAWYRTTLFIDNQVFNKRIFLRFEGNGEKAEVFLNGIPVGNHTGSFTAFCFEITKLVKPGTRNNLYVRVSSPAIARDQAETSFRQYPGYGIWRPVKLILTNSVNVSLTDYASPGVYIRQNIATETNAEITVTTKLENRSGKRKKVDLWTSVWDPTGAFITRDIQRIEIDTIGMLPVIQDLNFGMPGLWKGRDYPFLYRVVTEIRENGKVLDALVQPLGLRKFRIDPETGSLLNAKEYRLFGVSYNPQRMDNTKPPAEIEIKQDIQMIRELGARAVQVENCTQPGYFYSLCDSSGLVAWTGLPFPPGTTEEAHENFKNQLTELIRQNFNHPSILFWEIGNPLGASGRDPSEASFLTELAALAEKEDPGRYIALSSSNWNSNHDSNDRPNNLLVIIDPTENEAVSSRVLEKQIRNMHNSSPMCSFALRGVSGVCIRGGPDRLIVPHDSLNPDSFLTDPIAANWEVVDSYPFIWGAITGPMFDLSVSEMVLDKNKNVQCGLVTNDRREKTDAFYFFKALWSEKHELYIADKKHVKQNYLNHTFIVFCNAGEPELEVNGRVVEGRIQGESRVIFIWDRVELQPGMNHILVHAVKRGIRIEDSEDIRVK
jgi:beta-galactosidase